MSDKTYPYIGTGSQSKVTVLFYGNDYGIAIDGCGGGNGHVKGDVSDKWAECNFRDITREYLTNTYGKCESQEHADYICKIAEIHGLHVRNDYAELHRWDWFVCDEDGLEFYTEYAAKERGEKLIHLPLPPKENKMSAKTISVTWKVTSNGEIQSASEEILTDEIKVINKTRADIEFIPETGVFTIYNRGDHKVTESDGAESQLQKINVKTEMPKTKPIYTKEMHERGEYPPIGSRVKLRDGYGVVELGVDSNGLFPVLTNGKYRLLDIGCVKPIPTIEDELIGEINKWTPLSACKKLAQELLSKYNITPKGE